MFLTIKGLERDVGVAEKQHRGLGDDLFAGVEAGGKPVIRSGGLMQKGSSLPRMQGVREMNARAGDPLACGAQQRKAKSGTDRS